MVFVNNLNDTSKTHLLNMHPLSDVVWYSASANNIAFLESLTHAQDKMTHAMSALRDLSMEDINLKHYYQKFVQHLASCEWAHDSKDAVCFFHARLDLVLFRERWELETSSVRSH